MEWSRELACRSHYPGVADRRRRVFPLGFPPPTLKRRPEEAREAKLTEGWRASGTAATAARDRAEERSTGTTAVRVRILRQAGRALPRGRACAPTRAHPTRTQHAQLA